MGSSGSTPKEDLKAVQPADSKGSKAEKKNKSNQDPLEKKKKKKKPAADGDEPPTPKSKSKKKHNNESDEPSTPKSKSKKKDKVEKSEGEGEEKTLKKKHSSKKEKSKKEKADTSLGSKTRTIPKERKSAKNFFKKTKSANLANLSPADLDKLWKNFDRNGDEKLNRKELLVLANACNEKILEGFKDQVKEERPEISEKELEKLVKKEMYYLLPGGGSDDQPQMVRIIMSKLDINGDGEITKAEFKSAWGSLGDSVFKPKAKTSENSMACVIS